MSWQELVAQYGTFVLGCIAVLGVSVYVYAARRSTDAADSSDDHWRYRKP